MKEALGDRVADVQLSDRLTDSPCCLVRGEHGAHAFVERMLRERGHAVPKAQRILEVNGGHAWSSTWSSWWRAIRRLRASTRSIEVLYGQALLTEGSPLDDPNRFAQTLTELLERSL